MRSLKRLSIPVLLGLLLIAAVVGVASARPNGRPQEQRWRVLTVPAHSCIPEDDTMTWHFGDSFVTPRVYGGSYLVCPVDFPAAGEQAVGAVNVKRFTAYVWDTNIFDSVQAWLYITSPPHARAREMAYVSSWDSVDAPQIILDTTILNNPIYRVQGCYVRVWMAGLPAAYGFQIHYTWM